MNELNKKCIKILGEDVRAGLLDIGTVLDVLREKYTAKELEVILYMMSELGYDDIINMLILEKYDRNCKKQEQIEFLESCFKL